MTEAKTNQVINAVTAVGFLFGLYVLYCVWMIEDNKFALWDIAYGLGVVAFLLCFWRIKVRKLWALNLSYVFMLGALGLGGYLVHFVWTFWIFEKPTLMENILNTLHPRVSVFIVIPVVWFIFFSRKENRSLFI